MHCIVSCAKNYILSTSFILVSCIGNGKNRLQCRLFRGRKTDDTQCYVIRKQQKQQFSKEILDLMEEVWFDFKLHKRYTEGPRLFDNVKICSTMLEKHSQNH